MSAHSPEQFNTHNKTQSSRYIQTHTPRHTTIHSTIHDTALSRHSDDSGIGAARLVQSDNRLYEARLAARRVALAV